MATEGFIPLQRRLVESLSRTGWKEGLMTWTGELPSGSPSHREAPYGFKFHAMAEALGRGYSSLLWLDAPCVVFRPLEEVFSALERDGHCFAASGEALGHWSSDACLHAFGLDRDTALNLPLMNGAFIGLDFQYARSREWYRRIIQQCEGGLFRGAALTEHAPPQVRERSGDKETGHSSDDPRCWGHRHDEAVGSCLAHVLGMEIQPLGSFFGLEASSSAAVICGTG